MALGGTDRTATTIRNQILHRKIISEPVLFQSFPDRKIKQFLSTNTKILRLRGKY